MLTYINTMRAEIRLRARLDTILKEYNGLFSFNSHHKGRAVEVFSIAMQHCERISSPSVSTHSILIIINMFNQEAALLADNPFTPIDAVMLPAEYLKLIPLEPGGGRNTHEPEHSGYYKTLQKGITACISLLIELEQMAGPASAAAQPKVNLVDQASLGKTIKTFTTDAYYHQIDPRSSRERAAGFGKWVEKTQRRQLTRQNSFVLESHPSMSTVNKRLQPNRVYIFALYFNSALPLGCTRLQMRLLDIKERTERDPEGRRTHETLVHLGKFTPEYLGTFIKEGVPQSLKVLMAGEVISLDNGLDLIINNGSGHFRPSNEALDALAGAKIFEYFFPRPYNVTVAHYDSHRV